VEILCQSPSEIEDILADGAIFEILPEPKQSALNQHRTDQKEILADQITSSFERKKLLTKISEEKFHAILNSLYRSVVNTEEETGANTLFLALGILSWKETDRSEQMRRSPLLLLPVHLKKKSVGGKFLLSIRDDDTVINHTLFQKLKRDYDMEIPGLDPLPEDDSGVNVSLIFDIIRKVIRDKRGWEVKEEVWLSEFSFQKYLMWKELDNHYEEMLQSPIIRRIMTSEIPDGIPEFISEEKAEELLDPKNIYCPLSADSSQMAAVLSAANGNSFVLQGPPGTGKSQTIANMIAHCIGIGKRVLFVSEKKVALEVVYRRLQEIGIGPFCLELHSKKSEKKEVVKSFYNALEFNPDSLNGEWDQVSEELKIARDGLNNYFRHLHKVSPSGISAYRAFGVAARNQDIPKVDLEFHSFLELPLPELRGIRIKLKSWEEFANALTNDEYLAWAAVQKKEWNSRTEDLMIDLLKQIQLQIGELDRIKSIDSQKLPLNTNWKIKDWLSLKTFIEELLNTPQITSNFLKEGDFCKYQAEFKENLEHLKNQTEVRKSLDEIFKHQVFKESFNQLKLDLEATKEGFFLTTFFKKLNFKRVLKKLVKDELKPLDEYNRYFKTGIAYQEGLAKEEKAFGLVKEAIGEEYKLELHEDFKYAIIWADKINELLINLYSSDFELVVSAKEFITGIIENRSMALSESSELKRKLVKRHEFLGRMKANLDSLKEKLELNKEFYGIKPNELREKLKVLENTSSLFRDITTMNILKSELSEVGLETLFHKLDKGEISKSRVAEIFSYNFHRQWLQEKNESSSILNSTTGLQLNNLDANYKKIDNKYRASTEKALTGKISTNKPKMGNFILPDSPVGLIIKENKKSRRHLPIRKFLDSVSSVAKSLKPCYLMSPMSVSQYLPVSPDFDIVIFDEASQIPPWDAMGALARGKQAIIVGDTKQLPPTAFFSMKSEDDSDEKIDCESVLEMFGSIYPEMLLKWHYRSRSESLISFSNYHIYDNRLHTFPSSHTDDNKVSLEIVKGKNAYYDKGKTKTNAGEANAVVEEIFSRLKERDCAGSLGVVTFSSVQANLISDLIDARLQKEPKFENFFDATNPEYIFVKNLENVQGDERDVILFSVGYGKDVNGKISRNFGPLNNSGGERRLNVAVTRARDEVKIFSNFHPRELDVSTSGSEGLRLLKEYLLYAQDGHSSLYRQQSVNDTDEFDSPFEKEVAEELRKKGWKVLTQIGVGGYRVDLGVVHPDYPGQFLAGIECDGARYHSAKSARDRDILRQMVLEGLGWKILRIWSTDWWYDSRKCIDNLHNELKRVLAEPPEAVKKILEGIGHVVADREDFNNGTTSIAEKNPERDDDDDDVERYDPSVIELTPAGEFFQNPNHVRTQIQHVVEVLAPISREECFSIISRSWGFSRRGNRIDQYLKTCAKNLHQTKSDGQLFFWNSPEDVDSLKTLRLPVYGQQRHPSSVAPEELIRGLLPILKGNVEVPKDMLFREVARMLGYSRISKENMKCMEPALELMRNQDLLTTDNDVVLWCG
jgi:very-short-patch-repair endonuclease